MRLALGVAVLLAWGTAVAAAPPCEAKPLSHLESVKPGQVKLGAPFVYELTVRHPPDERYELNLPKDLGAFELLDQNRSRQDSPREAQTTFQLKLALFELGKWPVPLLRFTVTGPKGVGCYELQGPQVEGLSSLPPDAAQKGAALFDIRGPRDVPVRTWRLLYALAALALAGLAGYGGYRLWQRYRARQAARQAPPLPLDVRTRQALDQLKAQDLPAHGRGRELFFRLSEIVRGYLGERYGFEALECTGSELLQRVDRLAGRELPRDDLRRFVDESDLVKFAKQDAGAPACEQALEFAYALVQKTYLPPVMPTDAQQPRLS